MSFTNEQKRYIEIVGLGRAYNSYADLAKAIGREKEVESIREKYKNKGGIKECIADEIFGENNANNSQMLDEIEKQTEKEIEKIDKIFSNQFVSERKKGFKDFKEFYEQLYGDGENCYYCGTSQDDLNKLFKENNTDKKELEKPLYSTKPSFTATLQIDKMNPNEPYRPDNCVLACVFCNNAKSDWIKDANEFKNVFGAKIREFLKSKLPKK